MSVSDAIAKENRTDAVGFVMQLQRINDAAMVYGNFAIRTEVKA